MVLAKIDSFIGTLATGSLILALITMVTNDTPVSSGALAGKFAKIGQTTISGVTLPVIYMRGGRRSRSGTCSSTRRPDGACTPPASTRMPRGSRACR